MKNAWRVTVLCGAVAAGAGALLLVLLDHLRPHPGDLKQLREFFVAKGLQVRTVRRSRAVWRYHHMRTAWQLSRFARFYIVKVETAHGSDSETIAAYDPWHATKGTQIVSAANTTYERPELTNTKAVTLALLVSICIALLSAFSASADAPSNFATIGPFSVSSDAKSELSSNDYRFSVRTDGILDIKYLAPRSHCSIIKIHFSVDGAEKSVSDPVRPGDATGR